MQVCLCSLDRAKYEREVGKTRLGKGLALRVGYWGPCLDAGAEQKLLDAAGETAGLKKI